MVQLRSEQASETGRKELKVQLQALEAKIQEHVDLTKTQQDEAQRRREKLCEGAGEEVDGGAQRTLAIHEIDEQSRLIESDQISSAVVLTQVHSKWTDQDITDVMTSDNSRALVGLPESVVGKVNQRIKDVTTQRNSAAAVGVFDKRGSSRPHWLVARQ